jgi:hypothetical protein
VIPPAIGRGSSVSDRNAAFPVDPGGLWSPKKVTGRIRATEETATAIRDRYSDELLGMVASSPRFRPYEAKRRPAVFEYASTPRIGLQRLARGIGVREPKRGISSERGDAAPSRSGAIAVVNRVLEYFRPFSCPPAFIAETADLPEIIAGVVYLGGDPRSRDRPERPRAGVDGGRAGGGVPGRRDAGRGRSPLPDRRGRDQPTPGLIRPASAPPASLGAPGPAILVRIRISPPTTTWPSPGRAVRLLARRIRPDD